MLKYEISPFLIEMFLALLPMVYFLTAKFLNKVIDIIKFEKHFLNSSADTQSC